MLCVPTRNFATSFGVRGYAVCNALADKPSSNDFVGMTNDGGLPWTLLFSIAKRVCWRHRGSAMSFVAIIVASRWKCGRIADAIIRGTYSLSAAAKIWFASFQARGLKVMEA